MAKISIEKIEQFKQDVALLESQGISRSAIADAMEGVGKSNFSNYYNGNKPITREFLTKFYEAWEKKLGINDRGYAIYNGPGDPLRDYYLQEMVRRDNRLMNSHEKMIDGQDKLIDGAVTLMKSNEKLADTNQLLVVELLDLRKKA